MRTIWKGALTFGLVNVPVKVYSATEDHDVPLHQVHEKDGGRIRYQRTCEVCGETVAYADIDRAYVDDGQVFVVFLVLYASSRFVIEFWRSDDRGGWLLSTSQWIGLAMVAAAAAIHWGRGHRRARSVAPAI